MSGIVLLLILFGAHWYLKPNVEFDDPNNQIIIHYWWRKERRTYIINYDKV